MCFFEDLTSCEVRPVAWAPVAVLEDSRPQGLGGFSLFPACIEIWEFGNSVVWVWIPEDLTDGKATRH